MRDVVTPQVVRAEPGVARATEAPEARKRFGFGTRVFLFILSFVMAMEIGVYVPSIANFRENWLRARLSAGYTAALVLEAVPRVVSADVSQQLLDSVGARIIVLKKPMTRQILAASEMPSHVDETYDLRQSTWLQMIMGAYRTMAARDNRVLTILGDAPMGGVAALRGDQVELTLDEAPLRSAMFQVSRRILLLSLAASTIVAGFVWVALHLIILRPVRRLTTSLMEFGANPEDPSRIIVPSGRQHEIGQAEEALAIMQDALARELNQKKHLAALGLAVAKINHDMRNTLSVAQLLSDRLVNISDPLAQRIAPKLVATLDRAIRFCEATLTYGRAADEPPKLAPLALRRLVDEATESAVLAAAAGIAIINKVPEDFEIVADGEQLLRVILNLIRNSVEALQRAGATRGRPRLSISARREGGMALIDVTDNGPGVPAQVRATLFTAFTSSSRAGGTGLGLAIAADLVRAHGGHITLMPDDEEGGAHFRIALPARVAPGGRLLP